MKGMEKHLSNGVTITGGLAGDNGKFVETLISANNFPESKNIVAIGFYGSRFKIGYGSKSGFVPFSPCRRTSLSFINKNTPSRSNLQH
jgi:hypothetical protein